MDRAALAYIKAQQTDRGMSRKRLAELAGIPYQTVRGWWDAPDGIALSLADIRRFLQALGISGAEAYEEIERLAVTFENETE